MLARSLDLWDKLGYYRRMARGLHAFLATPPYPDPEALVRHQLENRERIWLDLVGRVIFANPENPYSQMFQLAGCTYDDLKAGVERDGLETTLAVLHREGVWLSHDEFKGKKPIVRGNRVIESTTASFRNPLVKSGMESASGGSRSARTKMVQGISARLYGEARRWLRVKEFGVKDFEQVSVRPVLPSVIGLLSCVMHSRMGLRQGPWFSTVTASLDAAHYHLATKCLVTLARLYGERVPYPAALPPDDYSPVSAWIARRRQAGVISAVAATPSAAARVAAAAAEKSHDIRDTIFFVGGEALTFARRRAIESTRAMVFPSYPISEVGGVGRACRQMRSGNSVHISEDAMGVISYRRRAPLTDLEVDSLLFTPLLEHGAFVVINVEMDDSGIIEPATCDCSFSRMGFRRCIRDIASFGKMTGMGITLMGLDVVRVLEEALPARFGGGVTDYQVVELDGDVQAKVELRVSRSIKLHSTDEVRDFFLREVRRSYGGALASRIWRDTAALKVVHEDPLVTAGGKVLPLHLMGPGTEMK